MKINTNLNIFGINGTKTLGVFSLFALLLAMVLPSIKVLAVSNEQIAAYGADTVAGYTTFLSTDKTSPNRDLVFMVKKPDGVVINISAKTDKSGVAKTDLSDYHTHKAGQYFVSAKFADSGIESVPGTFNVYADQLSISNSTLKASKTVAKVNADDKVVVSVNLSDKFGNPFQGHLVNLISSRSDDEIVSSVNQVVTDLNGSMDFLVSSNKLGVSTFSAVDMTTGTTLDSRVQIAFVNGNFYLADAGGNDGFADIFQIAKAAQFGSINNFDIGGLPPTVQANKDISFKVTARDQNNLPVENYTGTVHFSTDGVNGANVTLPEDYVFKADDLGIHQFGLGLKFNSNGTYKIVVTDVNNQLVKGELAVVVGDVGQTQQNGLSISISSPTAGTYSQNVQTVGGSAPAGSTVNIFDNEQQIGTVQADANGAFTYQTSALADGVHKLYAISLDANKQVQGTSATVQFTIDTTPPTVDEITITPTEGITANSVMTVKVVSEENLQQAAVVFNSNIIQLTASLDQAGTYAGSMQAPPNPGEYPIDVVLVDQLGNQGNYKAKAKVTITADSGIVTTEQSTQQTQLSQETQVTQVTMETQPADLPPSQVIGVVAYGTNYRVTLVWEAANDDKLVKNYRVYYGLDPANLNQKVDTKDAATTWYIPNLNNGQEYYFSVTAVDDIGQESLVKSEVASAIPFNLEINVAVPNKPGISLNNYPSADVVMRNAAIEGLNPPRTPDNGPEMIWLVAGSGAFAGFARKVFKKRK